MLNPTRTNRMTCSVCEWARVVDHTRGYRGGHTNPSDGITECHEMLVYEELDTRPPESPSWFEEEDPEFAPSFTLQMWDDVTSYVIDDEAHHGGVTYKAIDNNTDSEPPSVDWEVLA